MIYYWLKNIKNNSKYVQITLLYLSKNEKKAPKYGKGCQSALNLKQISVKITK